MAFGLRVWDSSGNIWLDTSTITVRIAGVVPFSAGSGEIPFTPSSGKTPFAWFHFYGQGAPYWSFSVNKFIWGSSGAATGFILYGER